MHMRIRATSDEFDRGNALGRAVISRRRFLRGLAGVGAAIPLASLLAACGGDDDDDNESAATSTPEDDIETDNEPTATTVDTGDAGGTRTVTHAMGTTEVPAEPSHLVAPSDFFATAEEKRAVREWEAAQGDLVGDRR